MACLLIPCYLHTVSDNACLLHPATVPSFLSPKHRNQDKIFPRAGLLCSRKTCSLGWPKWLGRAWSPEDAPVIEKLTGEFRITASHRLNREPSLNPSKSCMTRPSDMGSIPKVSMPKQGQYVQPCYSCVFLHGLKVGYLFVLGLSSCIVKAIIKQLLSCLLTYCCLKQSPSHNNSKLEHQELCVVWQLVQK